MHLAEEAVILVEFSDARIMVTCHEPIPWWLIGGKVPVVWLLACRAQGGRDEVIAVLLSLGKPVSMWPSSSYLDLSSWVHF